MLRLLLLLPLNGPPPLLRLLTTLPHPMRALPTRQPKLPRPPFEYRILVQNTKVR